MVAFLATFASAGGLLGLLSPSPAAAQDPISCMNRANPGWPGKDDYGQVTGQEEDGSTSDDIRGTRADLFINEGAECQRIQGLHVLSPSYNGEFEFAYIRGWWGPSNCNGVDQNHFYVNPTLFNVRVKTNGAYSCQFWSGKHPNPGQRDSFRASDINANGEWDRGGTVRSCSLRGVTMDFTRGHGVINMERGGINDRGNARFNDVSEYHDANGLTFFDDLGTWYDRDVDYNLTTPHAHTGRIQQ